MARKTIEITTVRNVVNNRLTMADTVFGDTVEQGKARREALADLLSSLLHDTGNYHGFNYLASEFLPAEEQVDGNILRPDFDETRRRYV